MSYNTHNLVLIMVQSFSRLLDKHRQTNREAKYKKIDKEKIWKNNAEEKEQEKLENTKEK